MRSIAGSGSASKVRQLEVRALDGKNPVFVQSSDRREEVPPVGQCRLCLNERTLCLSHIVPKWAFHWMKKEGGVLGTSENGRITFREQDGSKHYMLCSDCEHHLGEAEDYLAHLARGRRVDLSKVRVSIRPGPTLHNVNFELVMRGLLGILFKLNFATAVPYDRISFDRRFVDRLRQRIQNDDYPTHSLFVVATKWISVYEPEINPKSMVVAEPLQRRRFDLLMGGWSWTLLMSSSTRVLNEDAGGLVLRRDEPWQVLVGETLRHRRFEIVEDVLSRAFEDRLDGAGVGGIWDTIDPDSDCPCGLGRAAYRACCAEGWTTPAWRAAQDN
ncbi:hypothetical protein [Dactylosporangium sp. NPDC049140]|uniref:hypothetical protein n=1 Tax=Dactylosporangium sp. NPDC049140 TaxID=3155647 RepID=UPI0033F53A32